MAKSLPKVVGTCRHCYSIIWNNAGCPFCRIQELTEECYECHMEVAHGIITNQNIHFVGNDVPYTEEDAQYFPAKPWLKMVIEENANDRTASSI